MPEAEARDGLAPHPREAEEQEDRQVARPPPGLGGPDESVHDRRTGHRRQLGLMGRPIHPGHGIGRQHAPLDQPGAEARQDRLPAPQGVEGEIVGRHLIHPGLDRRDGQVRHPSQPPLAGPDEDEELLQVPAIGPHPPLRSAALLALAGAELFDKLPKVGHGLGPRVAPATTTFSPGSSIGGNHPGVKPLALSGPAARAPYRREEGIDGLHEAVAKG